MKTKDPNRAKRLYRTRLLEALHKAALKRGLYTDILPPDPPHPESEFRLVVDDMLFLMTKLPEPSPDDVAEEMLARIKALLDGCRTTVMSQLTPQEVYALMRASMRRAGGGRGTSSSEPSEPVDIRIRMLQLSPKGIDEIGMR